MKAWTTKARRRVLDYGKWLVVEEHTVGLPDGGEIERWPWLLTPDYVNICAVMRDGRFICFRQTKYAVDATTLAVPGGYIEPDEDPLLAAQRELREETGCEADSWVHLGRYAVDGNRGAGNAHLFLATGAHRVTEIDADDLEEQEMLLLSRAEVEQALASVEFKVIAWAAVVALALARLNSTSPPNPLST